MTTVLLTGGTGFIGRHVLGSLKKKGVNVVVASRRPFENLPDVQYVVFDLHSPETYKNVLAYSYDAVIHLAWQGLPNYLSNEHLLSELPHQVRFLTWLVDKGVTNLTVSGTCFEYGLKEGGLGVSSSCEPITYYGIAKNALRQYLQVMQQNVDSAFDLKWLRLFYVYGPGQAKSSLFSQLNAAIKNSDKVFNMSKGDQQRDFIYVAKAADNIVMHALSSTSRPIINIGSGVALPVVDFVNGILKNSGVKMTLNLGYYDCPRYEPHCFWGK